MAAPVTAEATVARPKSAFETFHDRLKTMDLPEGLERLEAFHWARIDGPRRAAEAAQSTAPGPIDRRTAEDFFREAYLEYLGDAAPDAATLAMHFLELGAFFRILDEAPAVKDAHAARRLTTTVLLRFQAESKTVGINWPSLNGTHFGNLVDAVMAPLVGHKSVGTVTDQQSGEAQEGPQGPVAAVAVEEEVAA